MITVAHVSDTHNHPSIVRQACQSDADLVLITGDCMSNMGRVSRTAGTISPRHEIQYQDSWYRKQAKKWARDLAEKPKPVLAVRGNHDFINYTPWLKHYGADVYEITDNNPCVELLGKRWAGFRQINWIAGEWPGEEHDLRPFVEKALACDPDILVTHGPCAGILDGYEGYGIAALGGPLFYGNHRITHHFFGHAHEDGGSLQEKAGIRFINGATCFTLHRVV